MDIAALLGALAGGIGLFLLGMWLMTDGLKLAAGEALRRTLETGTRSPLRGLAAGTGLTAIVQSSSAVTVATVGFVNAGLLTLTQAVWVVYGSNVGTTMTGWIVAATGIQVRLDAYALPQEGLAATAVFFAIGIVLTVLIQSSSATTAIALTARRRRRPARAAGGAGDRRRRHRHFLHRGVRRDRRHRERATSWRGPRSQ